MPGLRRSSSVGSPILVGVWRPTIVVPENAEVTFDEPALRMMLAHELAHLARATWPWNWLPTVTAWLFFFHPLVWLMLRRWSETRGSLRRARHSAARGTTFRLRPALLKLSSLTASESQAGFTAVGVLGAYRNLERRMLAISRVKPFSRGG